MASKVTTHQHRTKFTARGHAKSGKGMVMLSSAVLVIVTVLAACSSSIANAQTSGGYAPKGSYQQTCIGISFNEGSLTLNALCQDGSGLAQVQTSLPVAACDPQSDIENIRGDLQCNARAGTWGQGGAGPAGSYQQSCRYWSVSGTTLSAACWTYQNGRIDQNDYNGWAQVTLDLSQCGMNGDIENIRGELLCTQPAPNSPAALGGTGGLNGGQPSNAPLSPPTPPQNLRTSNVGGNIDVSWNNPAGVVKATVARTPPWPNAVTTMNLAPPNLAAMTDELAVAGKPYTYSVCLIFPAGPACGTVSGQLAGPPRPVVDHPLVTGSMSGSPPPPGRAQISHPLEPAASGALAAGTAGQGSPAPGTCKPGFVWREAYAGDQVCVTAQIRSQAAADNESAAQRQGANGQCKQGYVWRQADQQDHVCATQQTRAQTASDNAAGPSRTY
jgi:hypothetical protein